MIKDLKIINDHLDRLVVEALEARLFSGAALSICNTSEILIEKYFGSTSFTSECQPVDQHTLFDLASITKILSTTSIILRLIDRKILYLDQKISDFFPEAQCIKDIMIKDLLTHTSGEPAHFLISKEVEKPSQTIKLLLDRPLAYKTGLKEEYSCIGFILLGEILKVVSGKSLEDLFRLEVQEPLNLTSTSYHPATKNVCATKDHTVNELLIGTVHDENARFLGGGSANAGLFSNLRDLTTYAQMLLNRGRTADGHVFIQSETMALASINYTAGMAEDRGLGFFLGSPGSSFGTILGEGSMGHTGFTGTSLLVNSSRKIGIVFLTNRVLVDLNSSPIVQLRRKIHDYIGSQFPLC